MPFTPFHFGPGALAHAAAPKHLSFLAFCAANVMIDIEPLYYMLTQQAHLHRFFHTLIGAGVIALLTTLLFVVAQHSARRFKWSNPLGWQDLTRRSVAVGALVGTYSHILLDSLMHSDIAPLAPFSRANPLYRLISYDLLHWICVGSALLALIHFATRYWAKRPTNASK